MTNPSNPLYREISLPNKGMIALVDAEDYERISCKRWRAWQSPDSKLWYAVRTEVHADGTRGTVDHKKTADTLNNRKSNLRFATYNEQMRNQRTPVDNTSGVKGVGWEDSRKLYRATITVNYRQIFLGRRKTIEEAQALYQAAQLKYHGQFANFD